MPPPGEFFHSSRVGRVAAFVRCLPPNEHTTLVDFDGDSTTPGDGTLLGASDNTSIRCTLTLNSQWPG